MRTSESFPRRAQEPYGFFPPLAPLLSRALGFSALRGPSFQSRNGFSSPVLHRRRGVSPSAGPSPYRRNVRGHPGFAELLAEASSLFSIHRKRSPLLSPRRSTGRPEAVALTSGGAALRVWLPSQRFPAFAPSGASFSPRRS